MLKTQTESYPWQNLSRKWAQWCITTARLRNLDVLWLVRTVCVSEHYNRPARAVWAEESDGKGQPLAGRTIVMPCVQTEIEVLHLAEVGIEAQVVLEEPCK